MYRLLFLGGPLKGKRLTIQSGTILMGRASDCQICLENDPEAALHHAVIELRGGSPVIRIAEENASLIVNQHPVREHRLRHGDRIEVGGTAIEFQAGSATAPARQRRRFSKMQAFAFLAIALVALLQVMFVVFFPIWQKTETVQVVIPPEPPPELEVITGPMPRPSPPERPAPVPEPTPEIAAVAEPLPEPEIVPPPSAPPIEVEPVVVIRPKPVELDLPPELVIPEPGPLPVETRVPDVDPLLENARRLLADARQQIRDGLLVQADNTLHRVQMLAPDYVLAWRERAMLYEKRGLLTEAGEQWKRVMDLTVGTPEHDRAATERRRLTRLTGQQQALSEPAPVRAPPAAAEPRLARRLRITSVERERLQPADEYDEMRLVRFALRPQAVEGAIASDQVEVIVRFYDRIEGTDRLVPTRALVLNDGLAISGPWPAGEARNLTATYVLKRGFRAEEIAQIGERRSYEGHRVTLYYRGELQDDSAMPRRILELEPPPPPRARRGGAAPMPR